MRIKLSKYAGFCDGVKRAYDIVEKLAKDNKVKRPIFVLGSLVHNNDVVKKIEKMGIKRIDFDGDVKNFFVLNKNKIGTIVVRAHGIGPEFYKHAKKNNIDIIDATCPKVIKVQRLSKLYSDKGYHVLIVGEKVHKEVKGIYEWSKKKADIIENEDDIKKIKFNNKKIAIISQTTQSEDFVKKISGKIKKKYPETVKVIDTLCTATRSRQGEIKKLAKSNDIMIIIGSSKSANSTHLWEISKEINPNSYFIEKADDLKKKWFSDANKIGISAGASTPPWVIKKVCSFIENKL